MDIEKIHSYLSGELKGKELEQFEKEIQNNESLKIEVDLQREMMSHLNESADLNRSKSVLNDVHNRYVDSIDSSSNNSKKQWYIGALAIAAGIAFLIISNFNTSEISSDQLFDSHYSTPTASFMTKGSDTEESLQKAEIAFNSKNYLEALGQFLNLLNNTNELEKDVIGEVKFHIALCHISLGNYNDAIIEFQSLQTDHPIFENDSNWYKALIHIKLGALSDAKKLLYTLSDSSYKSKSEDLLKKIIALETKSQ